MLLHRKFKRRLSGFWAPFSCFARAGMADMGHDAPSEKLAHVKMSDLAFSDDVVLAEYVTFLEVMKDVTLKLYP